EKYDKNYEALSEAEFISIHGKPPWELVNEILKTFDTLKYRVTSPEGSDYFGNFQLKLRHTEKTNLEIEFSHLSSGERVLMALVASVYKSSADKHFPDLLLLDEVDASLHPSMMKNMLDVIERIFLQQGVKVILITHSPTTLALAPENSIYVMNMSGINRIEKKSKQEALSILTQGFATIEQGLRLFDQVANSPLTVITEGYNSALIAKALELHGIADVDVLSGVEGVSGKNQLRTVFQFIAKTRHRNKVLFVWDCDVSVGLEAQNNTFPFVLPRRNDNSIAKKGIENAFPVELFSGYTKTITLSNGTTITEFDEGRKRDFELHVLSRNDLSNFAHFASLITEIKRIRGL
ncbi:MAG TPA: AAA family ATPase, partial [Candidatus Wunengus sp. YC60]|uniref:AAA family ATPase n=1 Tax=Candidatus Wunengus sp. YC60 TaxID=3367697 RepID=UPI004028114F